MNSIRRIFHYAKPYWLHLGLGILCAAGVSLMTAAQTFLLGDPVEMIVKGEESPIVTLLPFIIIGVFMLKGLFRYFQAFFTSYAGQRAVHDLRNDIYAHVIRMPTSFFSERTTGDLLSRIVTDSGVVQAGFTLVVKNILQNVMTVLVLAGSVIWISPRLAPVALIALPIAIIPIAKLGKRLRRIAKESQQGLGHLSDQIQETVTGARIVKSYAMEQEESERFRERSMHHLRFVLRGVRLGELSGPIMESVSAVGMATLLWLGTREVMEGRMDGGSFMQLVASIAFLYVPIKSLSRAYNDLNRSIGAAERLFELQDQENEEAIDKGELDARPLERELRFEGVGFSYPQGGERPAVHDINLSIKRGEAIALVGRSGSGKSTIANLILRFYEPTTGRILADDTDLRDFRLGSHRRQIGWVSQDVILFDATVRENILYGSKGASEADLLDAARSAHALEFINDLPEGFDTPIGEKGVRLSGGQKQRLSIARTLLSNPPLLILDEATSALDTRSEGIVQKAIEGLMVGRTTIIIAHRLSTIQNASRIVVLEEGRIVEQGTLETLLALNGHYCALARGDLAAMPASTASAMSNDDKKDDA